MNEAVFAGGPAAMESDADHEIAQQAIDAAVHLLLSESAQKALETMFFAMPDAVSKDPQRPEGALVAAHLTFVGMPPGRFGLLVSKPLATVLACNFLGADDGEMLTPDEVAGVIGELSNMLCGVALSDLESSNNFELSTPQTQHIDADAPAPDYSAGSPYVCRFDFPEGSLVFFLEFAERS